MARAASDAFLCCSFLLGGAGRWLYHLTQGELRSDGGDEQRCVDRKAGREADGKAEVGARQALVELSPRGGVDARRPGPIEPRAEQLDHEGDGEP